MEIYLYIMIGGLGEGDWLVGWRLTEEADSHRRWGKGVGFGGSEIFSNFFLRKGQRV